MARKDPWRTNSIDPKGSGPEACGEQALRYRIQVHGQTVRLSGTVNVAAMHKAAAVRRPGVKIPLRTAPGASAAKAGAVRGDATPKSPLLTITPGTPLAGALGNQDNVNQNGFSLTPPDMGLAVGNGYEVQFINDVGRIWQGSTSVLGPFALSAFFTSVPSSDFISDPWLLFDLGRFSGTDIREGRITTAGVVTEFSIPTPDSGTQAIASGPDGNLWFTESNANKIGRITTAGVVSEFSIPTANSGAFEIAAGPDGKLWFR